MVSPTYPGVYVEEVSSGVRAITAAGTSTAAFIGQAQKGSLSEAVKVYNFTQFENQYGTFLDNSYLAHSVYQFFNNGGSQCYIVRVSGENVETANIVLHDRAGSPLPSITVSAVSPGIWGNELEIGITDGTINPGNEFNLRVFMEGNPAPLESFDNLTLIGDASNFVEAATSNSKYIRVTVDPTILDGTNVNIAEGTSTGAGAPVTPPVGEQRMRVNINGDGYQEINLAGEDLSTPANIAAAIQLKVRALTKLRDSTDQDAFNNFTCTVDGGTGALLLTSGAAGVASSVNVAPGNTEDATGFLQLGTLRGGVEALGGSINRPLNSSGSAAGIYRVGDHDPLDTGVVSVVAGADGDPIINEQPYINGLQRLNDINDVSLIAVPGIGSDVMMGEAMNYCETRSLSDCFFIGDMAQDDDTVLEAQNFVAGVSPKNSYGAVYIPWLLMLDPTGASAEPIAVPPSGYIAGLYAKTDAKRGVWKAPAGTGAGLAGATGLTVNYTDVEQGNLNPNHNINVIRQFAASGRVIWGARTITSDAEWRYVPVRRMAIFLRVSIYRGIQWAVFEPNDEPLWTQLKLNITSFMMPLYRRGAFQGSNAEQAFFVKCDSETTTQDDIDQGIVNILVGFAPLKPAEFVIVKLSQKAGQPG